MSALDDENVFLAQFPNSRKQGYIHVRIWHRKGGRERVKKVMKQVRKLSDILKETRTLSDFEEQYEKRIQVSLPPERYQLMLDHLEKEYKSGKNSNGP